MSHTVTQQNQITSPGASWTAPTTRTGGAALPLSETLPVGQAGVLTRSDTNTGVATLTTGHGITTGMKVSVCWAAGFRVGMDATVDGNSVTVDGGAGDDLPAAAATAVVVTEEIELDADFDPAKATFVGCASNTRTLVRYVGDSGDTLGLSALGAAIELVPDSLGVEASWEWVSGKGTDCPLVASPSDPVNTVIVSNGSATSAATFKGQQIWDPTT